MPTSLCEMIHQHGLPPEGMALHVEADVEFRYMREAKSLIYPVTAHNGTQRRRYQAQVRTPPRPYRLELKYPAPKYNPKGERLPQLLIHKSMPEPVLHAASLRLPARKAGVASW